MIGFSLTPLILIGILLVAWWWRCGMQAKEIAIEIGRYRCKQRGLQLLDETVALKSWKIKKGRDGHFHFHRFYQFEYYDGSLVRKTSTLTLIGTEVADLDIAEPSNEDNVVELGKYRQH